MACSREPGAASQRPRGGRRPGREEQSSFLEQQAPLDRLQEGEEDGIARAEAALGRRYGQRLLTGRFD